MSKTDNKISILESMERDYGSTLKEMSQIDKTHLILQCSAMIMDFLSTGGDLSQGASDLGDRIATEQLPPGELLSLLKVVVKNF